MKNRWIGAVICDCFGDVSGRIDTAFLENETKRLENVSFVMRVDALCNGATALRVKEELGKTNAKGFLFAGCSPRTSLRFPEARISAMLSGTSLDSSMFEVANIREQCAWLHHPGASLNAKAMDEIRMAHARLCMDTGSEPPVKIEKKALIIGGGSAGLAAAKDLSSMDIAVTIVEQNSYLGGRLCQIRNLFQCENWNGKCLNLCVGPVQAHNALFANTVSAYVNSTVVEIKKKDGNFLATIKKGAQYVDPEKCISCGKCSEVCGEVGRNDFNEGLFVRKAIDKDFPQAVPDSYNIIAEYCTKCGDCVGICPSGAVDLHAEDTVFDETYGTVFVSTGFALADLSQYPEYGTQSSNVITGMGLERLLDHEVKCPGSGKTPRSITFILCSGSRATREKISGGVPYCSKTCCGSTMRQALLLTQRLADVDINIIYHYDIRTYERAFEQLYDTVKRAGVEFVQGNLQSIDENDDGSLTISLAQLGEQTTSAMEGFIFEDEKLKLNSDLVVLASAEGPRLESNTILKQLKVPVDRFGFPLENQPRIFRPTESFVDRVYVAGSSTGPKVVQQAVEQGRSAAMNAIPYLMKAAKTPVRTVSRINSQSCINCRFCETICPHGAISVLENRVVVDPGFCQGCGLCQSVCPTHAVQLNNFTDEQLLAQVNVAFNGLKPGEPKILALLCYWCSYCGADLAGKAGYTLPDNFRSIRIRCSSSVNTSVILGAFRCGVDGVLVAGCPQNNCHHLHGNYLADKRTEICVDLLRQMGLNANRLQFQYIGVPNSRKFAEIIKFMDRKLRELGPNPIGLPN